MNSKIIVSFKNKLLIKKEVENDHKNRFNDSK